MDNNPSKKNDEAPGFFPRLLNTLVGIGLGESMLRAGTTLLSVILLVTVIWLLRLFYAQTPAVEEAANTLPTGPTAPVPQVEGFASQSDVVFGGIPRLAQVHTNIPSRPRQDLVKYTVVEGDTLFGIAEKFGLKPETVLWGNYSVLLDDPHSLTPGQELIILPSDGIYWEWTKENKGGLIAFAEYFGAKPEDIVNAPANNIDPATIDLANPNIPDGTWLFVPGGKRELTTWYAPLGVTRENPAAARVMGPGACDPVSGGAVGYGTFVWPANKHYLSGFDYNANIHRGIDIAGNTGEAVYATDAGVVVYAGWNNYGYGNMIMVDHGNNFQSLYAHLSGINVGCGQSVGQGELIGAFGNTGRSSGSHLHFEIRSLSSWVNPWDVLPPP
ncbi:MAG: M23 family metallopeptidase [Anaerolineales bacterium]|nr:M23 family metallopeptidase [Anaerolineales bacterium]